MLLRECDGATSLLPEYFEDVGSDRECMLVDPRRREYEQALGRGLAQLSQQIAETVAASQPGC